MQAHGEAVKQSSVRLMRLVVIVVLTTCPRHKARSGRDESPWVAEE